MANDKNHNIDASRLAAGTDTGNTVGRTLAAMYAALAAGAKLQLALQLQLGRSCAAYQDTASHCDFPHDLVLEYA